MRFQRGVISILPTFSADGIETSTGAIYQLLVTSSSNVVIATTRRQDSTRPRMKIGDGAVRKETKRSYSRKRRAATRKRNQHRSNGKDNCRSHRTRANRDCSGKTSCGKAERAACIYESAKSKRD